MEETLSNDQELLNRIWMEFGRVVTPTNGRLVANGRRVSDW